MDRPHIITNGRQLRDIIQDMWNAIKKANAPEIFFQREGKMVALYWADQEPKLEVVTAEKLFSIVLHVADYFKQNEDGEKICSVPPRDITRAMVTSPDQSLPIIEGVSSVPMFLPDSTLWKKDGYCPQLKTYFYGMQQLSSSETGPETTGHDVQSAVRFLREEVYANFPFAGDGEFAHVLATLLLPFVRPLVKGATPIHLIEANGPGSGKTLLAEVNTAIATGFVPGLIAPAGSEEEMRKRITSYLSEGQCNIILDNVSKEINSGVLASAITGEKWQDRPLYGTRIVTLPNRATWQITANNPRLTLEVARRCIRIRLLGNERPWERQEAAYKHPNLLKWVLENRRELIDKVRIIVQHWFSRGKPGPKGAALGSFEGWVTTIGGILQTAGVDGFLANSKELYAESDPESAEWEEAVEAWWAFFGEKWVTVSELEALCVDKYLLPLSRGGGSDQSRVICLGKALAARKDLTINGRRIMREKDITTKKNSYRLSGPVQEKLFNG